MDSVKAFRFLATHVDQFQSMYFETAVENTIDNFSGVARAHSIGFDYSKS